MATKEWRENNKEHINARKREWYQNNKEKVISEVYTRRGELIKWFEEYKSTLKCSQCEEDHTACLDFHHIDSSQKESTIYNLANSGCSIEKILVEIAKCKVLCSNCHRKLHYNERKCS